MLDKLLKHFGEKLLILSSFGYANLVTFCSNAAAICLKMLKDDDSDDLNHSIKVVAKQTVKDCKLMDIDKSTYSKHIDQAVASNSVSPTLQSLLTQITDKFDQSLTALMIGNIVTSEVTNQTTDLQIALGILLRESKSIPNHMHDYSVKCSYDEVLRFKKSVTVAASIDPKLQGIYSVDHGLVQIVADNFDAEISCPNGKVSTHSLAMIVTQPLHTEQTELDTIKRLHKDNMKVPIQDRHYDISPYYEIQRKPEMSAVPQSNLT